MLNKFRWYEYEVWGNAKDGYDVNNVFRTGDVYEIPEVSDAELTKYFRKIGFFKKGIRSKFVSYDGDEDVIYITYKDRPEGEFRRE